MPSDAEVIQRAGSVWAMTQDLLPARTADEFATLLTATQTKDRSISPLFGMMVQSAPSTARKIPRTCKSMTVARRHATRSKTSS